MTTQTGPSFEIQDSQPDPSKVDKRLAESHELCEQFRQDQQPHLAAIRRLLADGWIKTADQIEAPNHGGP
jgi:hypothetical protein